MAGKIVKIMQTMECGCQVTRSCDITFVFVKAAGGFFSIKREVDFV
jgi:hypothetical protein